MEEKKKNEKKVLERERRRREKVNTVINAEITRGELRDRDRGR